MAHAAVLAEKDDFCNAYFPTPSDPSPNKPKPLLTKNPFAKLATLKRFKGNETAIREEFVNAVNAHNLIPGLALRICGERPDGLHIDATRQKVDAAWYFERDAKDHGKPEWGDQVIPVEFKGDETADDPFDDEKDIISTATKTRKHARGQMITYSELLHAIQQRTALFMLIVIGKRARFSRWDRSGTVVTRSFNYIDDWRFFCDVLWRIGHCSHAQLGFDPTATRLSQSDPDWQRTLAAAFNKERVNHSERVLKSDEQAPDGEFEFEYVRDMFKHSLVPGWPRYRVEVPEDEKKPNDEKKADGKEPPDDKKNLNGDGNADDKKKPDDEKKVRSFLIGKPTFRAKGMAGRGTRGYVALDCDTGRLVWLKDAWRANYEFVEKEGDILAALNKAQVSNVPTMLCHGDIEGQTTETPDWWVRQKQGNNRSTLTSDTTRSSMTYVNPSSSAGLKRKFDADDDNDEASTAPMTKTEDCPLRLHQHYRLVVQEVAMPLDRFQLPRQLVKVMFDCVLAHYEATTKPETPLLHRDISSGNILIYPRVSVNKASGVTAIVWTGILADWEMSKPVHRGDAPRKPRQPERTGTWQYTSIALLGPGNKHITLADELESFFHVFLYFALRYIKSVNCDGEAIATFLDHYFDVYGAEKGMYTCGALKIATVKRGKIDVRSQSLRFGNPLDALFKKIMSWFMAHYLIADYNKASAADTQPKALLANDSDLDFILENTTSDILAQFATEESVPQPKEGPTAEDVALAKVLESHNGLMLALGMALREQWPNEKAEDQIPAGWKPSEKFPTGLSKNVENRGKRQKQAREYVSEPLQLLVAARPPVTPQRRAATSQPEDESP